jgi:hypothetical protein
VGNNDSDAPTSLLGWGHGLLSGGR